MPSRSTFDGADMSRDQEPTAELIANLIYRARFEFAQEDMRDRIRYSVFNGDNDIPHPSHIDFQEVHMNTVNKAVEDLVGVLSNRPTVHIDENSLNTLKVKQATNVQNFLNAVYPALEDQLDDDVWLKTLKDQVVFGRAYDILEYDPTRWAEMPRLSSFKHPDGSYALDDYDLAKVKSAITSKLPMIWRHLPVRGCFAWKDDYGISQFLSIEERSAEDIAHSYQMPSLLDDLYDMSKTPSQHVIFCRYWNRSYYAYWISKGYSSQTWEQRAQAGLSLLTLAGTTGELTTVGKNIYGVVPVIETKGLTSTDQNPARMHLSPIDAMIPTSVYLDVLMSQKGSAIRVYTWPTPYIKNVEKELGAPLQQAPISPEGRSDPLNIVPGQILYLPGNQEIGWLVVPQSGPDIDKQIAIIEAQADKLGIPSQLFSGGAEANGYLYNQQMQAVLGKLAPMVIHQERAHRKRAELLFRILEIHGDSLYVYQAGSDASDSGNWTQVTPKDVVDWRARYVITVNYQQQHPYDEAQNISAAQQLTTPTTPGAEPLLSKRTARAKYLDISDPDKEKEQIRIERIEESPLMDEFLNAEASMDAGITLEKIQNDLGKLTPEQIKMLPPSLQQAAQALGQNLTGGQPAPQAPGMGGGGSIAAPSAAGAVEGAAPPSAVGGIPGATQAPSIPGNNPNPVPSLPTGAQSISKG